MSTAQINIKEINFKKMNNLVPTIIQEQNGTVLSLVYSSKESLEKTIQTGKVWKYSRQRKKICMKGATSGNIQEIIEIRGDCDSDALFFKVKQIGNAACHTGKYSCFGEEKKFDLQALYNKIANRKNNSPPESYTKKLFENEMLLKRKLIEEAAEVITAKNREELIWECSDLIYFLLVIMVKEGISIEEIEKENGKRDEEKRKDKRKVADF
ncbi:MAG: bifunctional phosphoribosyl-AMP cyclohydrolase/phosphoribosyl-ATP diphosphatase HisIE [archaeon]